MATSKHLKIAKERLANKGYKKFETKDNRSKIDRELSVVNSDYINSFIKDADSFIESSRASYDTAGYDTTSGIYEKYKKDASDLDKRAKRIRAYTRVYGGNLDKEAADNINKILSAWSESKAALSSAFEEKSSFISSVKDADEYDSAMRNAGYMTKYGNMSRAEREKALNDLKVGRAEDGKVRGDDKALDSEIDFLEYYGLRQGYGTSAEYDEEIRDLVNRKAEIEEHYVNGESFTAEEQQRDNTLIKDLTHRIESLKNDRKQVKEAETLRAEYGKYTESPDFEEGSKYVSTAKNLSDEEIKTLGYKKDKTGEWYKNVGLGGVEYYDPAGDMVYEYINADDAKQNDMMLAEKAEMYATGNVMYNEDVVKTSRYKTYGEMNEEEVKIYNYLYQNSPEDAKAYLDALSPTLDKRFDAKETQRLAEIGYDNWAGGSLISIASNLESGLLAPAKVTADLFGADGSKFDSSSRVTTALRQGAGQKWGEALDFDIPLIQKNAGEFAYNTLMSIADMGVALGLGVSTAGSQQAASKITQFIMSSEAASSEIYSAHEEGLSGVESAARGVLAGAIEAITEKYSIENLLSNPKGIIKGVLTQAFTEATEESAATLLNTAVDVIASEIAGHANEFEKNIYKLMSEGMTSEEAEKETLMGYLRDLGTDALAGALSGAVMGGSKEVTSAVAERITGNPTTPTTPTAPTTKIADTKIAVPEVETDGSTATKTTNVARTGRYTVSVEDGKYSIYVPDADGEMTVINDDIDSGSIERRVLDLAEKQNMTPATAQKLLNDYDSSTNADNYIEEADYVYSMGKAGVPMAEVSRGAGLLSTASREMLYTDGAEYTREIETRRTKAYNKLREATSGVITRGSFDTTNIKGMKLNASQERNVRFAEALSSLGFNIKVMRGIASNKKAIGAYNPKTGVIEVDIDSMKKRDVIGAVRGQFMNTLSHEITHQMRNASSELYAQYRDIVLGGFSEGGNLDSLLEKEIDRLQRTGRYKGKNRADLLDIATDEIVARASENMLRDSEAIQRVIEENRSVGEKILEVITNIVEKLKSLLKEFEGEDSVSEEANLLREMTKVYEEAKAKWSEAFADTVKNISAERESGTKVDKSGEVLHSEGEPQYSLPALDNAYMDAVNNGDMETAQRLVDEAAKKAMPDSKLTTEDGRLRTVYHGTNTGDFTVFNPDYIGMSSGDDGFFGMGFYFAYTKGEAAYYGAIRIIPAYLNITNPFNFDRELQTYKGKKASGGYAPDAVAFMNFADKFPDIAKNVTVEVVEKGDDTYKDISLIEFAEAYKSVIENKKFKYDELTNEFGEKETLVRADPKTHEYEYNGEKRSYVDYGFHKRFWGTPNDLDVAYEYLAHSVYDTVDMYSRTRLIIDNNREFTAALKEMGYDGAIQSEDGDEAVVFDSSQIKLADPVTYDDNGNVIPLSERFRTDNPDIRYSEAEDDYMDAVNRGDTENAKRLVDRYAIEQGFTTDEDGMPDLLFHGTDSFGFTKIDTSKSDDDISFWATPNMGVAGSYYEGSNYKVRELGKEKITPKGEKLIGYESFEEIVNRAKPFASEMGMDVSKAKYVNESKVMKKAQKPIKKAVSAAETVLNGDFSADVKNIASRIINASKQGTYKAWTKALNSNTWNEYSDTTGVHFWELDIADNFSPDKSDISKITQVDPDVFKMMWHMGKVLDAISQDDWGTLNGEDIDKYDIILPYNNVVSEKGIYGFYHKESKPFIYDCEGAKWNQIAIPNEVKGDFNKDVVSTRDLAKWAFDHGYDAIKLENVIDVSEFALKESRAPADVWAFKKPEAQLKSADPITYDDNGNVIPLSERFNTENNDIRYSESESTSMRETLAGALLETAQDDAERSAVEEYQSKAREYDSMQRELDSINREIKQLSFAKGKRNTGRLSELRGQKAVLEKKLQRADKKLLELEATKSLKDVLLRREKQLRTQKADALKKARAEAKAATAAELERIVKEERAKAHAAKMGERMAAEAEIANIKRRAAEREIERRKSNARSKVKDRAKNLISYITNQTDKKNVKEGIRGAANEFMRVILKDTGMFTPSEMGRLRDAYTSLNPEEKNTPGHDIKYKGAYDFEIMEDIKSLSDTVAGKAWRDLTLEELEAIDRVTSNLRTMIRKENKIFRDGRAESRLALAEAEKADIDAASKRRHGKSKLIKVLGTENFTPYYFFKRLGGTMNKLFKDVEKGQDKAAREYHKALLKLDSLKEKYSFKDWYNTKAKTFKAASGTEFDLTIGQMMYIYAANKRETLNKDTKSETDHLLGGGIFVGDTIDEIKDSKGKDIKDKEDKTIRLSDDLLLEIIGSLTDEQKTMTDALVEYLSVDMSALGNEVSMQLFGINKFHEKYYIPFSVYSGALGKNSIDAAKAGKDTVLVDTKLKHMGSTNAITTGASEALLAEDIFDIWAEHVVEMVNYSSFVLPIEAFESVLNFNVPDEDGSLDEDGNRSTRMGELFRLKYGNNALNYLNNFMRDLNGGIVRSQKTGTEKLISYAKKNAVAANVSVVVQQPTALLRAMAVMDPKYLATIRGDRGGKTPAKLWDEMKQYAPGVTVTKEMGRFDIGSGAAAKDYIHSDKSLQTLKDKAGAVQEWVDDKLGLGAEWGDRIAWIQIWRACKAEVADKTGLTGEALLEAAGKRFTEVINKTQVYDSILVRSGHMRNTNPIAVMATAYKGEPTLTLNLLADALASKNGKVIARTAAVFLVQALVTAAVKSLAYAARDDDEDKTYLEKYLAEFSTSFVDDVTIVGGVPYLADIVSIFKGYDVTRMDMDIIKDIADSYNKVMGDDPSAEDWGSLMLNVASIFGVPAKNIWRDIQIIPNMWKHAKGTSKEGIGYAIGEAFASGTLEKTLNKFGFSFSPTNYAGYMNALEDGDTKKAREIQKDIIEYKVSKAQRKAEAKGERFKRSEAEDDARSSIQSRLTRRYKEAYIAAYERKDTDEMARIKAILRRSGVYKKNISDICRGWVKDN